MKKWIIAVNSLFILGMLNAQTQEPAFRKDIDAFKKADSRQMPAANSILFVGSSSFTKWTDVQDYFPGYPILNRGFGGSTLADVIRYADEIIIPYHPKQIIIYCGENDIAASDTITPQIVSNRFQQLFSIIRKKLGKVPVGFISIKPSPSRWKLEARFVEANRLIKAFLDKQKNAVFIDVHTAMLNADGSVKTTIFIADNLHMNAKGYHIWQPIIANYLNR
ncbi:MAG: G-D-S-L family lipolytic protein [Bacteroidota bacterium]|nr:G-D-S-L family lipolytic protein [Bacteroidota bacterium]